MSWKYIIVVYVLAFAQNEYEQIHELIVAVIVIIPNKCYSLAAASTTNSSCFDLNKNNNNT